MMRASRILLPVLATAVLAAPPLAAQSRTSNTLDIYLIDVEGGNATLFVSPSGESLLIDTGYPSDGRDAGRIMAAARDAGVARIDHLITTHYHRDHIGGLSELTEHFPVTHFIDHGPNQDPEGSGAGLEAGYKEIYAKAAHTAVKAGDAIPMAGVDVRVVTSAGETITAPLPGAGDPNPYCATFTPGTNNVEDPLSVGIHVTFGEFRTIHLGDLTKNKEFELMCPNNRLGTIDVLLGLHHGQVTSNSEVLVHALRPRVGIMNNGTRKGGDPEVMRTVFSSPGFQDLWQAHFSLWSGQEYTVPGLFIANMVDDQGPSMPIAPAVPPQPGASAIPTPAHDGVAYWVKVSAQQDGTYTVTNARNGFSKTYTPGR
jgi:competence protein ComEC